jgi:hypothetical protein
MWTLLAIVQRVIGKGAEQFAPGILLCDCIIVLKIGADTANELCAVTLFFRILQTKSLSLK